MTPFENIPRELLKNPHFARYYRTWQKNDLSIVFIPLAQICREQGFLNEARAICEKGLSRHPASVSGRLMLARIYLDLERTGEAKDIVEKVLEEFPAQQEARALLDKISGCRGEPCVRPSEQPPSLWENVTMAKIYAEQGETRIALQILEKILARDAQNARASELMRSLTA